MNNKFRKKALDIIKKQNEKKSAGIEDVRQKVIDASRRLDLRNKTYDPEAKDYMTLAREYQAKYRVDIYEAMRAIEKKFPYKRREYIRKHNPSMDVD